MLTRVFRNLLAEGFCSKGENGEDEEEDGDDGDVGEGTGMGEGYGEDDVSEQIEDEEQVAGLKDEEELPPDPNKQDEKKKDDEGMCLKIEKIEKSEGAAREWSTVVIVIVIFIC